MFLCTRFTEFAIKFDLMSPKLITIPKEALKIWSCLNW